jgi:uncharacterized protein YkwD
MTLRTILPLLIFGLLACGKPLSAGSRSPEAVTVSDLDKLRAEALHLVNEYRAEMGKPALKQNETVEKIADQHSFNMARGRAGFGHDGFEARNKELGKKLGGIKAMAENVAYGKLSAARVVDMWLGSAGHRKNIEGNYNTTGIGISKAENGQLYFTQIFVLK